MNSNNDDFIIISNKNFHCCYLLRSLKSKTKTYNYIGYTNNPIKRLSQHNGIILGGAKKTIRHRPWEMLFFVKGFINEVMGLQFEWAWQHPHITKYLKDQPIDPKGNILNKRLRECIALMNSPPFCAYKLKIVFLNYSFYERFQNIQQSTILFYKENDSNNNRENSIEFETDVEYEENPETNGIYRVNNIKENTLQKVIVSEYLTEEDGKNLDYKIKTKLDSTNNFLYNESMKCIICNDLQNSFETTKSVIVKCNKCSKDYHLLCLYYKLNASNKETQHLKILPVKFICVNDECTYEEEWYSFIKHQKGFGFLKRKNKINVSLSL